MEQTEHFENRFKDNQPAVIAVFEDQGIIKKILFDLKENKFDYDDISIIATARGDIKKYDDNYHLTESATAGLIAGMFTGAVIGWLIEKRKIRGSISSVVKWSLYGGTIGGVSEILMKYGISKIESKKMESYLKDKGIIVSVHVDNPKKLLVAKNILVKNGAVKINNPPNISHHSGTEESKCAQSESKNEESDNVIGNYSLGSCVPVRLSVPQRKDQGRRRTTGRGSDKI